MEVNKSIEIKISVIAFGKRLLLFWHSFPEGIDDDFPEVLVFLVFGKIRLVVGQIFLGLQYFVKS